MLHTTAQERYQKLKKLFRRLMDEFNRDDLDDFIATAKERWGQTERFPSWIKRLVRIELSLWLRLVGGHGGCQFAFGFSAQVWPELADHVHAYA